MVPLKDDSVSVESLRERLSDLRAKRGVALMDGEPIERLTAEIANVSAKADALDDLEAAEGRRHLELRKTEQQTSRGQHQKELDHFVDKALTAVADAENAMRTFVAAYKSMRSLYYASGQVKRAMGGKIPSGWDLVALNDRFGYRIGNLLSDIDSINRFRLGHLTWAPGPYPKDIDWAASERIILEKDTTK